MAENHGKLSALILYDRNCSSLVTDLKLHGNSMYPAIRQGQTLTCKFSNDISIGDIIVFWKADRLVAHRVVNVSFQNGQKYYIEKGDNSLAYSILPQNDVLGKVIAIDGERKRLSIDLYSYIVNYVIAKISYGMAIVRGIVSRVTRKVFRKRNSVEAYIGNLLCRRTAFLLLCLLCRSRS